MKKLFKEIFEELISVFTGKSIDILLPPLLFLVLYRLFNLEVALVGSLVLSIVFFGIRIYHKSNWYYALGGLLGVIFAVAMSYLNNNASDFFLPDIIATVTLILITVISLLLGKPLAALVSHITRGWDLNWFYRKDVLPAYKEVTIFWLVFFIVRLTIEVNLYVSGNVDELVVANIILGLPLTIGVLTVSYIYGIWRLHNLKGPGVDEFANNIEPPWRGQNRGF
jgi:hypothetical protein